MLKLVASPGSNQGHLNHSQEKTPRLEILSSSSSSVNHTFTAYRQSIYRNTIFFLKLKMSCNITEISRFMV